jgi:hypothetical protein
VPGRFERGEIETVPLWTGLYNGYLRGDSHRGQGVLRICAHVSRGWPGIVKIDLDFGTTRLEVDGEVATIAWAQRKR